MCGHQAQYSTFLETKMFLIILYAISLKLTYFKYILKYLMNTLPFGITLIVYYLHYKLYKLCII